MKLKLDQFIIRTERVGEPIPDSAGDSPEMLVDFYRRVIQPTTHEGKEHVHVILLNSRLRVMGFHLVSMGTVTESAAHPREVLRPVIVGAAYAFAMVHNHPSGDPSPSRADETVTRRMADAAALMQVKMIDHVIIGEPAPGRSEYFSFREAGIVG